MIAIEVAIQCISIKNDWSEIFQQLQWRVTDGKIRFQWVTSIKKDSTRDIIQYIFLYDILRTTVYLRFVIFMNKKSIKLIFLVAPYNGRIVTITFHLEKIVSTRYKKGLTFAGEKSRSSYKFLKIHLLRETLYSWSGICEIKNNNNNKKKPSPPP